MSDASRVLMSRGAAVVVAAVVAAAAAGGYGVARNTPDLASDTAQVEFARWHDGDNWGPGFWGGPDQWGGRGERGRWRERYEDRGDHGGWRMGSTGGPRMARMCETNPLRFQGVVRAYLKADLDLTGAQSAEFDKFADTIVASLTDVRGEACGQLAKRGATAPERLEQIAAVLKKASAAADAAVGPAKSFYAQLDDKQKARVEDLSERRRGRRWGGPPADPATPPANPPR